MNKLVRAIKRFISNNPLKVITMHLIVLYQKRLSRHTCLYTPTCSEYTLRSINNLGFFAGVILGLWRILRCNPLSRGGYDPALENHFKVKWVY